MRVLLVEDDADMAQSFPEMEKAVRAALLKAHAGDPYATAFSKAFRVPI